MSRRPAHLRGNGIDLEQTPLTLGRLPRLDSQRERFADAPQADALLTRSYRRPFVVPDEGAV